MYSYLRDTTLAAAGRSGARPGGDGGAALGAAFFNAGISIVANSAFLTNRVVGGMGEGSLGKAGLARGAGIYSSGGNLGVVNSTFAGNSAMSSQSFSGNSWLVPGEGSAIYNESEASAGVTNSTIAWNASVALAARTNNLVLKNSLLVSNLTENADTRIVDAGHNLSSDSTPAFLGGSSRNGVKPLIGPLGFYGGATPSFPLLVGSPASDAADDAAAPPTDQRGRARPYGSHSDIGAFESSAPFYVWGEIRGFNDPTTTFAWGTNSVQVDESGAFAFGPLPAGTNQISLTASNALFRPNPWTIALTADTSSKEVVSFRLHSLNFDRTTATPVFVLAGLPQEKWRIESSTDLHAWTTVGTFTLDASGLADVPVANTTALFLRAVAVP